MRFRRKAASRRITYTHYGAASRRAGSSRASTARQFGPTLKVAAAVVLVAAVLGVLGYIHHTKASTPTATASQTAAVAGSSKSTPSPASKPAPKPTATTTNYCAANTLSNFILVSISKRHLWACSGSKAVYNSAVVTGMENLPADLTPTGTYHIYGKQTNLYLNGSDSTGSWHDYVYYWMPFLSNQYGVYGFHDATWRKPGDFGNISPYTSKASHGCVETPLATSKWLYGWAPIGTTVTIES